jgi:hypothetical protein
VSLETERQLLLTHVRDSTPAIYGPIAYPNVPFQAPSNSIWLDVSIVYLDTLRKSLGRDFFKRYYSTLQFSIYSPSAIGSKEAREVCDWIETHYEDLELVTADRQKIVFETPKSKTVSGINERKEGTNDNWFRMVVDCNFYRDCRVVK